MQRLIRALDEAGAAVTSLPSGRVRVLLREETDVAWALDPEGSKATFIEHDGPEPRRIHFDPRARRLGEETYPDTESLARALIDRLEQGRPTGAKL